MNTRRYEFEAVIQKVPDLDGTYVCFPYNVKAEFGKGWVKVEGLFDKEPCHNVGLCKDIRKKLGKHPGDMVRV